MNPACTCYGKFGGIPLDKQPLCPVHSYSDPDPRFGYDRYSDPNTAVTLFQMSVDLERPASDRRSRKSIRIFKPRRSGRMIFIRLGCLIAAKTPEDAMELARLEYPNLLECKVIALFNLTHAVQRGFMKWGTETSTTILTLEHE